MRNNESISNTPSGGGTTGWEEVEHYQKSPELQRQTERWEKEQSYIEGAKRGEAFTQGLGVKNNSEKAEEIRKNIDVLYHMQDQENLEKEVAASNAHDEKILSDGREEMKKGNVKDAVATRNSATEVLARAEFTAGEFAKAHGETTANNTYTREKVKYKSLMDAHERLYAPGNRPKGFFAERRWQKAKEKNLKELRRYGFTPGNKSREIEMYEAPDFSATSTKREFGEKRAGDYAELIELTRGRYGRAVKKQLKKKGFEKLPENESDLNYTTYEMAQMRREAESAIRALTYKQKKK